MERLFVDSFLPGVDFPYIAALLPNGTIEIHSLTTLEIVAVLACPEPLRASYLSRSINGYLIPSASGNQALQPVSVPLLPSPATAASPPRKGQPSDEVMKSKAAQPAATLGIPPSLSRSTSARSTKSMAQGSFTRSKTLILGSDAIQALLPSTLVSQIESLLDTARLDDAIELAAQAKQKVDMPEHVADTDSVSLNGTGRPDFSWCTNSPALL